VSEFDGSIAGHTVLGHAIRLELHARPRLHPAIASEQIKQMLQEFKKAKDNVRPVDPA
jgi:hypothetical protein